MTINYLHHGKTLLGRELLKKNVNLQIFVEYALKWVEEEFF